MKTDGNDPDISTLSFKLQLSFRLSVYAPREVRDEAAILCRGQQRSGNSHQATPSIWPSFLNSETRETTTQQHQDQGPR
jgi:hypothetical protein